MPNAKVGVPRAKSQTKQIAPRPHSRPRWIAGVKVLTTSWREGEPVIARKPVAAATQVFLEHGARAASKLLGDDLRARVLLPVVFARAKYLVRCAKREADMIALARDQLAARVRSSLGSPA